MGSEQALRGTPHPVSGKLAFYGLIFAQTLTLAAFLVVLGSLSQLQKTANGLALDEATQAVYTDVFQSVHQIPYPLPGDGPRQFAIQWYLLFFELAVFLVILPLLAFPRHLIRFKTALIAFLTYFFALVTLQVESILYFTRNPAANLVYGEKPLKAALAGVILVTIANPLSIIFLGLLHEDNFPERGHNQHVAAPGTKRVSDSESPVARV